MTRTLAIQKFGKLAPDDFSDATDDREPEIPSYETGGPHDNPSPFEEG